MSDVLSRLQLTNSALDYLQSEHKLLDVYKDRYTKLYTEMVADEDVSCETMQALYTLRDYIVELESYISDLLVLFVEFGTGRAQENAEAMLNIIKNNN